MFPNKLATISFSPSKSCLYKIKGISKDISDYNIAPYCVPTINCTRKAINHDLDYSFYSITLRLVIYLLLSVSPTSSRQLMVWYAISSTLVYI